MKKQEHIAKKKFPHFAKELKNPLDTFQSKPKKIKVIPTGISSLENAIGAYGIPRGCLVLVSGSMGSGKTSFAYYLIASAQRRGNAISFVNVKNTFNFEYAAQFGVETINALNIPIEYIERLGIVPMSVIRPSTGDYKEVSQEVETLIRDKLADLIIIDGTEDLFPYKGDATPSRDIKAFSSTLRKWSDLYKHSKTSIIVLCREGEFSERIFKFYADLRLDIKWEPGKDTEVKGLFKIKVIMNKFAEPFKEAEIRASENYLKDRHQEKIMGLEVICSDCSRNIEKGEMYWVTEDERGKEKYICELCESEKTSRGIEEDIKKYRKVIFTGLD